MIVIPTRVNPINLKQTATSLLFVVMASALFLAPIHAKKRVVEIRLPSAEYEQHDTGQGFVSQSPDRRWVVYWANEALHRYPAAGRSITSGNRYVDYLRWSRDGTRLIVGSPDGGAGQGWAWLVDSRRFIVLRKFAGNIAAAWFEGSGVSYIRTTSKGPLLVRGKSQRLLSRSIEVASSTEDGKFLLARTLDSHRSRVDLAVFRNARTGLRRLATVLKNAEFADAPCELIVANPQGEFLVTRSNNQIHATRLCSAYFVSSKQRRTDDWLYFDLKAYWTPSGFSGFCRTIQSQAKDGPIYAEYKYQWKGKLSLHKVSVSGSGVPIPIAAYSVDEKGHEVCLLERDGRVFLRLGGLPSFAEARRSEAARQAAGGEEQAGIRRRRRGPQKKDKPTS